MNQRLRLPALQAKVPRRLIRGAWLSTLVVVVAIGVSLWADVLFPIPFLVLLTTVVASGAIGGIASGLISAALMTATILYFWSQGIGPEALTGSLFRAVLGAAVAVFVGAYIGMMREQLAALISELEARQLALTRLNTDLSDQIAAQTADLRQASNSLRDSQSRLLRAMRRWIQTEELERGNLARELHDDIGQGLTALHLNLETSRKSIEHDPGLQRVVTTSKDLINKISESVRQLSTTLRPSLLDDLGLVAAVREHASAQFGKAGVDCEVHHEGNDAEIDAATGIMAYRLMQEAVNNVIQHASASRVRVDIRIGNENLEVRVKDDGRGFDVHDTVDNSQHWGLTSMRERAAMMAGSCRIQSQPNEGTDVTIMLPLTPGEIVA